MYVFIIYLYGLCPRSNDLCNHSDLGPLLGICWQEPSVRMCVMKILHDGNRLGQGYIINDQSWYLAHGVDLPVLLTTLDPLDKVDRLHVHLHISDVQSNSHSPRA